MDHETRLTRLEDRVVALEAEREAARAETRTPDDDVFWALNTLKEHGAASGTVLFAGYTKLPQGGEAHWQESARTDDLLDGEWAPIAGTLAALGHRVRLILLQKILTGTTTAHDLLSADGVGTSGQVYHHLRQLVAAGWLRTLGGGRYEVPVERVIPLLVLIAAVRT